MSHLAESAWEPCPSTVPVRFPFSPHSRCWRSAPIRGYRIAEPESGTWDVKFWTIEELLDSRQLDEECLALHHCVGTYAKRCALRYSSIWSLRRQGSRTVQRIATIEVDLATRRIVTALGRCNTRLTRESREVMLVWAEREGFAVAGWV